MGMEPTAAASFLSCMWFPFRPVVVTFPEVKTPLASFLVEPSVACHGRRAVLLYHYKKYELKGVQTWH